MATKGQTGGDNTQLHYSATIAGLRGLAFSSDEFVRRKQKEFEERECV